MIFILYRRQIDIKNYTSLMILEYLSTDTSRSTCPTKTPFIFQTVPVQRSTKCYCESSLSQIVDCVPIKRSGSNVHLSPFDIRQTSRLPTFK